MEYVPVRLMAAAKEFGVGKDTLVEFLVGKGFSRDDLKPVSKLTEEMYKALEAEFPRNTASKLKSDQIDLPKGSLWTGSEKIQGPKIVGKIDLPPINERPKKISEVEQRIRHAIDNGLDELDLSGLKIEKLPDIILRLKDTLRSLTLGAQFPNRRFGGPAYPMENLAILKAFQKLDTLHLFKLEVENANSLAALENLKELNIFGMHTSGGLNFLNKLVNLKRLDISDIPVNDLSVISDLGNLQYLTADSSGINDLRPFNEGKLPWLISLNLSRNPGIIPFLRTLNQCHRLERLTLDGLYIDASFDISSLRNLKYLSLQDNLITGTDDLLDLHSLDTLKLASNKIEDIGDLARLKNLRALVVSGNLLDEIPSEILTSGLREFYGDFNDIKSTPRCSSVPTVKSLVLNHNSLEDIDSLADFPSLRFLNLDNNNISDISPLKKMILSDDYKVFFKDADLASEGYGPDKEKGKIILANNPITTPPPQYWNAGTAAVINYWADEQKAIDARESKQSVNEARLIIVGNGHVGKTTLAHYFIKKKLPEKPPSSTHGLEFSTWEPDWIIDDQKLSVNIIDFGGQEYYHDTHHLFFNDKAVYIVLWNAATNFNKLIPTPVGDRTQIADIRHFEFEYWLNAIGIYGRGQAGPGDKDRSSSPVLLVQTHADKDGKTPLNLKDLCRRYPQLSDSIAITMQNPFRDGELLQYELGKIFRQLHGGLAQEYNESWFTIKAYLRTHYKGKYEIVSIEKFTDIFNEHSGVSDYTVERVKTACITLNHWGVILYKYEIPELSNFVIINPERFTNQINELLKEDLRKDDGIIRIADVQKRLKLDALHAGEVLKFLRFFKILFQLPQQDSAEEASYISPMYLSESPKYLDLILAGFTAYYRISFAGYFHKGILLDCFSELGKNLYFGNGHFFYWQWGMVLRKDDIAVCIEFDKEDLNHILIRLPRIGDLHIGDEKFIIEIFAAFEKITSRYNVSIELSLDGAVFIPKETILQRIGHGFNKVELGAKSIPLKDYYFLLRSDETPTRAKRVFISYSSKDRREVDQLTSHLDLYKSAGALDYWMDTRMDDQLEWSPQILEEMKRANVLIMLLSPGWFGSSYIIGKEMRAALDYLAGKKKQVHWILLKPCDYQAWPEIAKYPVYPKKEYDPMKGAGVQKAVTEYPNQDRVWSELLQLIFNEDV